MKTPHELFLCLTKDAFKAMSMLQTKLHELSRIQLNDTHTELIELQHHVKYLLDKSREEIERRNKDAKTGHRANIKDDKG